MFTIKAFNHYDNGSVSESVFSGMSYQVYSRENGSWEVSVYKDLIQTNGVSFDISKESEHYDSCYIENMSGKTIKSMSVTRA